MEVRKFEERTLSQAMEQVKKEFGNEAVIIATEQIGGKTTITAAKGYDVPERVSNVKRSRGAEKARLSRGVRSVSAVNAYKSKEKKYDYSYLDDRESPEGVMSLEELDSKVEMDSLQNDIKNMKKEQHKRDTSFLREISMLRESLSSLIRTSGTLGNRSPLIHVPYLKAGIKAGIEEDILENILKSIADEKDAEKALRDEAHITNSLKKYFRENTESEDIIEIMDRKKAEYVFTGPTGVGKTTTIAKIATTLVLEKDRDDMALVSLDFMRADGGSQLERFAKILGRPCYVFSNLEDYRNNIKKIRKKYPLIMTDTCGVSPLNITSLEFLEKVCKTDYTVPVLHIPVATEYDQALSIHDRFGEYTGGKLVIFTKEDESLRNGLIASMSVSRDIRTGLVTNGQRIPEDIIRIDERGDKLVESIFRQKI